MNSLLPPLPSWEGLHPLIVHFPIALLLVAPLLVIAALLWRTQARALALTAFALMVIGTAATWIAVGTGEAAGERAEDGVPAASATLERHEDLAEATRTIFTVLTVLFGVLTLAPLALRRSLTPGPTVALQGAFLVFYAGGTLFLVNTAHQGGRLVHEFGVRAALTPGQSQGGMTLGEAGGGEAGESGEAGEAGERGEAGEGGETGTSKVSPAPPAPAPAAESAERGEKDEEAREAGRSAPSAP